MNVISPGALKRDFTGYAHAEKILQIGLTVGGFKQSKAWKFYADTFDQATQLARQGLPAFEGFGPDLRDKPVDVIRSRAAQVTEHATVTAAAEEVAAYASDSMRIEADRAVEEIAGLIRTAFDKSLRTLRANLGAPETLSGYESEQDVAEYQARLRAANEVAMHAALRVELGRARGEMHAHPGVLWVYLEPPTEDDDTERVQTYFDVVSLEAAIAELAPVERLRILLSRGLPLSIAPLGGIESRRTTYEQLRNRAMSDQLIKVEGEEARRTKLGLPSPVVMA